MESCRNLLQLFHVQFLICIPHFLSLLHFILFGVRLSVQSHCSAPAIRFSRNVFVGVGRAFIHPTYSYTRQVSPWHWCVKNFSIFKVNSGLGAQKPELTLKSNRVKNFSSEL